MFVSECYLLESLKPRRLRRRRSGKMDGGFRFQQMVTHGWLQHPKFLVVEVHQPLKIVIVDFSVLLLYSDVLGPIFGCCYDFVTRYCLMKGPLWMVVVGYSTYYYKYLQHLKRFRYIQLRRSQGCSLVYFAGCLFLL